MKRFWTGVAVSEEGGAFAVRLDGRPVRLPGGGTLSVAARPLAEALAAEWDAAGRQGEMRWDEVPLTRLVGTAAERIAPDPAPTVAALARYGETDLLCYRAEEGELAAAQAREWTPWLGWARDSLGAGLAVTEGLMPAPQPPAALAALERAVAAHPPLGLAALGVLVPALGSLVLGLAVTRAGLDPAEAHRLSLLDELHQEARWGLDWEAEERRARVAADLAVAARLAALAG
ncbi:ATP12 family protein [Roseococcus sp. DSY-14]|uniref:ATP12 family protein n=1 Tax=Roseococcus sp. DSY-14 TaxID=3369650 RepID=UPI00387AA3F8